MNNPFLDNNKTQFYYVIIWLMLCIAQVLVQYYTFDYPLSMMLWDTVLLSLLLGLLLLLIWFPIQYYRAIVSVPLFLLFHVFLCLMSVALCLGADYLLGKSIFPLPAYVDYYGEVAPLRVFTGVLSYALVVLGYYLLIAGSEVKDKEAAVSDALAVSSPETVEVLSRITVKKNRELHVLKLSDVHYLEANGDYVLIHSSQGRFMKDKTMKYWEMHLPADRFVRIHRSYIINIEQITKLELYEKDAYRVYLKTGICLKVSSGGYKQLKTFL